MQEKVADSISSKIYFNWSTGKDSALALHYLLQDDNFLVEKLVTSINSHHDRVSMHGLKRELMVKQAKEIGIPLTTIELPEEPTMEVYNEIMSSLVANLKAESYTHTGFGDIFLEDLRNYREQQLKQHDISCVFPLWKKDTKKLTQEFFDLGFKAIVICIKSELLDESFIGREFDESFINDLPSNVDPCGENGEFHTFCYDGPIFNNSIKFERGEKVYREYKQPKKNEGNTNNKSMGFWFFDLTLKKE
jgi:uncharacterized protein (TIGR00290 family)